MFLISILAETNRPPFDLPEAEAELVSGYNVEYSALTFALFFLGEYSSIIIMSSYCVLLFIGGYLPIVFFFSLKVLIIIFVFV
jgi:NADH-quinone oxidoreductase subunit H